MNIRQTHPNLIVAIPHPDDEVMLAGEMLTRLQSDAEIAVVTATDGAASTEYHRPGGPPYDYTKQPEEYKQHIADLRRAEHQAALAYMGITQHNQYAVNLPDGELARSEHLHYYAQRLASVALTVYNQHGPVTLLSLGEDGFDGHPDHKSAHMAAVIAAGALSTLGIDAPVMGLSSTGTGALAVPIDGVMKAKKIDILRHHPSQMHFWENGQPSTPFFDRFMFDYGYAHVFEQETYDVFNNHHANGALLEAAGSSSGA